MRIGQTTIIYVISKFGGAALGFLITVYITRTLGEEVYGYYSLTLALAFWVGVWAKLGLIGAVAKRVSEGKEKMEYITAGGIFSAFILIIMIILLLSFRNTVNSYVGVQVVLFLIVILVVDVYKELINSILKGLDKVHIYAPLSTTRVISDGITKYILIIFGFGLSGILVGYAMGGLIVIFIGIIIIKPRIQLPKRYHFERLYDYARYAWMGKLRGQAYNSMDIFVLGVFVSPSLVGIYAAAWSVAKFLDIFGNAVSNTLFPKISRSSTEDGSDSVSSLVESSIEYCGLFVIPGLFGVLIIGEEILRIFGPAFPNGSNILILLIINVALFTYTKQYLNALNAIDRPDLSFKSNLLFLASNLILNLILVWSVGWKGAPIAGIISCLMALILSHLYIQSAININLEKLPILIQLLSALVMYGTLRIFYEISGVNKLFYLFEITIVSILGAIIFFVSLLGMSSEFRELVIKNIT